MFDITQADSGCNTYSNLSEDNQPLGGLYLEKEQFRTPLPTATEELQLVNQARAGSQNAKAQLLKHNHGYILSRVFKKSRDQEDTENLYAAGALGLCEALHRYDAAKGRFHTYARHWIEKFIHETKRAAFARGRTQLDGRAHRYIFNNYAAIRGGALSTHEIAANAKCSLKCARQSLTEIQTAARSSARSEYVEWNGDQPDHDTGSKGGYSANGLSSYTRQSASGSKSAFLKRVVDFLVAAEEKQAGADLRRLGRPEYALRLMEKDRARARRTLPKDEQPNYRPYTGKAENIARPASYAQAELELEVLACEAVPISPVPAIVRWETDWDDWSVAATLRAISEQISIRGAA